MHPSTTYSIKRSFLQATTATWFCLSLLLFNALSKFQIGIIQTTRFLFPIVVSIMTEPTLKTSSSSSPPSPLSFITVVQASTLNIRVQGGTVASPRQFPHIISIQYQTQPGAAFEHTCGGTIISSKFILTASHCNFESDGSVVSPSKLSIVYGTNVLSDCPSSQIGTFPKCQRVAVKRVMNHAQYNEQLVVNDIALYELATPISNLPLAHIAKIPRKNPQLQTPHYIVGWGITSDASGVASNEQRVGVAPLVDDSNCNKLGLGMSSSNGQLCAGNGDGKFLNACCRTGHSLHLLF